MGKINGAAGESVPESGVDPEMKTYICSICGGKFRDNSNPRDSNGKIYCDHCERHYKQHDE